MRIYYLMAAGVAALTLAACSPARYQPSMGTPSPSPEQATSPQTSLKQYLLLEQNDSGQTGSVTLSENADGKAVVTLSMIGGTFTAPQPAHIHSGSCPTPGAVVFPLTNVVDGQSETVLDASVAEVLAVAPQLAVNVHKSAAESKVYTACANL